MESQRDSKARPVETDEKRYAVLQQQVDGMHYVTRDDTLISTPQENGQWLITADTVRPFNGRIIYVEGEAVKVIQFTKDRGTPLFFSYKETGQNQWVGMPQLEEGRRKAAQNWQPDAQKTRNGRCDKK